MPVTVMQDRLAQQQRGMVDERTHLKEIIAKMETQLTEQQRQLEKVRVQKHDRPWMNGKDLRDVTINRLK